MKFNYRDEFDDVRIKSTNKYRYIVFFKEDKKQFTARFSKKGENTDAKLKRKKDWNQLYNFSYTINCTQKPIITVTWTEISIY